MKSIVCVPKSLTLEQIGIAVRRSIEVNPANATNMRTVERTPPGRRGGQRRLALLVGNRWPPTGVDLTVQFLDSPSPALRSKILLHMNAWSKTANIRFTETRRDGMVRIARLNRPVEMAGYWSYVGTEILGIGKDEPTLNLEGFTMRTEDEEFLRVVRHEAGHTLGFEHEHMRSDLVKKINRSKAFAYFARTEGWSRKETLEQVLTPLSAKSIIGTSESDPLSIMCYDVPGEITKDGKPIRGGDDINLNDYRFAGRIYPKPKDRRTEELRLATQVLPSPPEYAEFARSNDADTFHIVIMDEFKPESATNSRRNHRPNSLSNDDNRPRYARVFASYGGARVTGAMHLRATKSEPPTAYGNIIRVHERIKNYTNQQQGTLPSDDELIEFGGQLFEALFQDDVRRLYDEARARQQNRKLDIVFTSMIPWIAEKPWEFAYDAARNSFLATEEIHLVRNVLTAVPPSAFPLRQGPLRILVASAQPVGSGELSIDQEVEVIHRGFKALEDSQLASTKILARATPNQLLGHLATGNYNVVHIIGHGVFDHATEEGAIVLEDDRGGEFFLGERSVREIFCKRGVSLVFLNSCQSGAGGRKNFNKGIAQALVSHGLPAVVANQYSVLDSSATSFAQHFYWSLAHGMSIGQAACDARIAVNCSMQGELIDWAVPVVYARDPNMVLCAKPDQSVPVAATAMHKTTRRRHPKRDVQVAVWDIDSVYPAIEHTLNRMNDVQNKFGFELVSLSAPIDAWYLEERAIDGSPYLWAEKLARRLQHLTVELRVNILACITQHWLCSDDDLDLYGWWPDEMKPPVIIFSTAGFELTPESPETDRAIANVTVSGLAGFLGGMGTHTRGPKDCPLSYNEELELSHMTGRQSFDRDCRNKLKKKIPQELKALESILTAF
jgi:hypothetical protein